MGRLHPTERNLELLKMYRDGVSKEEIGQKCNVSQSVVANVIRMLGKNYWKGLDGLCITMDKSFAQGLPDVQIADNLKTTEDVVFAYRTYSSGSSPTSTRGKQDVDYSPELKELLKERKYKIYTALIYNLYNMGYRTEQSVVSNYTNIIGVMRDTSERSLFCSLYNTLKERSEKKK